MAATHGVGTYGNAVGTVTPLDHKMAQLGLVVKSAANTIRAGLFWDGNTTIVSGKANMSLDIRAFTAALSRGATAGAVLLSNDAVLNKTTDVNGATLVAPGSNSVYWNVFVWQREFSIDGTDSNPVIAVLVGTTAASPTVPALTSYPGAVSLATVLVPAGTTATNSGTTITQTAPFTASAGGVIPFRSTTERDAGTYQEGQLGWLIDTDALQSYNGTSWTSIVSPVSAIIPGTPVSTGGSASVSANGEVTFGGSTSDLLVPGVFSVNGITEIEIEMLTSSTSLNCTWGLVTAGGTRLVTGYTGPIAQYTTSAATVSTAAGITTAWQNLRVQSTTGGHAIFRVARAADTKRKSMHGNSIDAAVLDAGGGWNSSTAAHTGVWFTFGGGTATGVARFRLISNQS